MALDLIIRGNGSIRSPHEHIAAVQAETGEHLVIYYGTHEDAGVHDEIVLDPAALGRALAAADGEATLVYGDEQLLSLAGQMTSDLIWIAVGPKVNPVRELWRLRGAHAWLATRHLALLLEDEASRSQFKPSASMAAGRVTKIVVLPPAAAADEPAAEAILEAAPSLIAEAMPEETPPLVTPSQGVSEPMQTEVKAPAGAAVAEGERNTETALLTRYSLVRERRLLAARLAQADALIQALLKELFATRFAVNAETATAFEDVTRKLADAAAEYRQLTRDRERVAHDLEQLAWLKGELEM